jgi:hypothetical protein
MTKGVTPQIGSAMTPSSRGLVGVQNIGAQTLHEEMKNCWQASRCTPTIGLKLLYSGGRFLAAQRQETLAFPFVISGDRCRHSARAGYYEPARIRQLQAQSANNIQTEQKLSKMAKGREEY